MTTEIVDVVGVGGGPSGATAAADLARAGRNVVLLDRAGRIKPCGGAIPPRLMKDFAVPESVLVGHAKAARMIAPSNRAVDMPIEGGFVGMVDRGEFDEWLRERGRRRRSDAPHRHLRGNRRPTPTAPPSSSSAPRVPPSTKRFSGCGRAR